ncbi:tRNA epoxyqueuosine(34) reductase QueG [Flaviaesturariibacter flavus]|uniref:Epoxyqueuosine reductase n=1 Tax=Flaviaesturariibacter flavus TaxID=2502780 RepID=A0A4R1B8N3_9BACT|nr:tRNA epoxyqueuosine(34) reductase QueG [Flaviaesturariibacter flavus]TCJ12449.1 tRNA epoxyqueuosine(34) reductase QueG [Flaviaesturariibacter flavus]
MSAAAHTRWIKDAARRFGFDHCGIARAEALDDDARRLEQWLSKGYHGSMQYMANHFDLRVDPRRLVPGARSVITFLKNYYPAEESRSDIKVARYAWGADYHEVIRAQLNAFLAEARAAIGNIEGRGFVDSAPVLERSWAGRSGLGWVGKNGNLINKGAGSFFFIATLITDLELEYDAPYARDYCGSCTRCIDACPTDAILPGKTVDGSRCISYFTIELKDLLIPQEHQGKFGNWMFGCDICQEVCPWNRFSTPNREPAFTPVPEVLNLSSSEWEALSEEAFRTIFRRSPLSRAKHRGIQRNLRFLKGDQGA